MRSSSGSQLTALQDGAYLRTRWGLRGDKDLGDGYTGKFTWEQGLNDTSGAPADSTRQFDRHLWAGLATPIAEARFGRQNTAILFRGGYGAPRDPRRAAPMAAQKHLGAPEEVTSAMPR